MGLLRKLLTAKQLSLISELRSLYPIVEIERGRVYTIRGLTLPDARDLAALPDEQVSTALGYTCHCVSLLAKYLRVPLRYTPHHMASRSTMRDEVLAHTAEYPLYAKSGEPNAFLIAVLMLQRDMRQLLHSQGIGAVEPHVLGNMQKLFGVLLDAALPPADAALPAVLIASTGGGTGVASADAAAVGGAAPASAAGGAASGKPPVVAVAVR